MLTPDDGRKDGKFISYLSESPRWEATDRELYHFLRAAVIQARERQVSTLAASEIIPSATFVDTILDGSVRSRETWLDETISLAGPDTIVFFDPDNGLEVKSVSKRSRDSSKYLYWDEVERVWSTGSSLLIYQHFMRENREKFIRRLANQFRSRLGAPHVSVGRTANVAFFLVPQKEHLEVLQRRAKKIGSQWQGQIRFDPL
jgi:hypothetical protein